jgi:hypothetical protein
MQHLMQSTRPDHVLLDPALTHDPVLTKEPIYSPYLTGLYLLVDRLGSEHPHYLRLLTLQQRLEENIRKALFDGDTETTSSDRASIIYELNRIAVSNLDTTFNSLCSQSPARPAASLTANLPITAWTNAEALSPKYPFLLQKLNTLAKSDAYEDALSLYWKLMYFTGTRELWTDRDHINSIMLAMAKKAKDWRTCGLIIADGVAWPFIHTGQNTKAHSTLSSALPYLSKTSSGLIVYYDSLAELHEASGHPSVATDHYNAALAHSKNAKHDLQEYKIIQKRNLTRVNADPIASASKLVALEQLRDKFKEIKSFREAIVDLEIAKTLHELNSSEALPVAMHAHHLLENEILMPSRAAKALRLIDRISRPKQL